LASLGFDILTLTLPARPCGCGSLSASRLQIEFSTPRACSDCEPGVWGARRARFGLSILNGNVLRGRIEGGQGVRQCTPPLTGPAHAQYLGPVPSYAGPVPSYAGPVPSYAGPVHPGPHSQNSATMRRPGAQARCAGPVRRPGVMCLGPVYPVAPPPPPSSPLHAPPPPLLVQTHLANAQPALGDAVPTGDPSMVFWPGLHCKPATHVAPPPPPLHPTPPPGAALFRRCAAFLFQHWLSERHTAALVHADGVESQLQAICVVSCAKSLSDSFGTTLQHDTQTYTST
jgi:hypothetical protein